MDPQQEAERDLLLTTGESGAFPTDDDNRGWNRLSIRENSRKAPRPPMQADDLLMPSGLGNRKMLANCAGMSAISAMLYIWVPLMLLNFFVDVPGVAVVSALAGSFVVFTLGLYLWGTIETRRDRDLGTRL